MKLTHYVFALIASSLASLAWAQSSPQALSLNLPPDRAPSQSATPKVSDNGVAATAPATANASTPTDQNSIPAAFYFKDANPRNRVADGATECDDSLYSQPQVHGSVTTGIVGGSHVSGNYESGVVNVTQALGTCDNPTGIVSLTVGVGQGNFNNSRHWRH